MIGFDETTVAYDSPKGLLGKREKLDYVFPDQTDRRRTPRLHVQIPMFVYGYASGDVPFHEEARTIAINSHGGLICMQTAVHPGQRLVVTNEASERTQECVVVFVETRLTRGVVVAIEFRRDLF